MIYCPLSDFSHNFIFTIEPCATDRPFLILVSTNSKSASTASIERLMFFISSTARMFFPALTLIVPSDNIQLLLLPLYSGWFSDFISAQYVVSGKVNITVKFQKDKISMLISSPATYRSSAIKAFPLISPMDTPSSPYLVISASQHSHIVEGSLWTTRGRAVWPLKVLSHNYGLLPRLSF